MCVCESVSKSKNQELAAPRDALEARTGDRRRKARASQVADDDRAAGRNHVGRDDGLAQDAVVEDFLDDGELGELGHGLAFDCAVTHRKLR